MTVAPVCRVGDSLQLTCTAPGIPLSEQFLRWSIRLTNEQDTFEDITINSRVLSQQLSRRVVNSTTFTFMRRSDVDTLSLISVLSIDSVSIGLNGTVVRCFVPANQTISASTTIQIVNLST